MFSLPRWTFNFFCAPYSDIGKSCPDHEVVYPGLQLQDIGWREDDPGGGQHKEEDGGKERQEGFVQAAVLQGVAPVSPEKSTKSNFQRLKSCPALS